MSHLILKRSLTLAIFAVLTCSVVRAAEPLHYELRFERSSTHLIDVTIHAADLKGPSTEFAMPDWAPGSYYLENYAANVQAFRALGSDGKDLMWIKRIARPGALS